MTALDTTQITGRIALPNDVSPSNAVVRFTLTGFDTDDALDITVIGQSVEATIDSGGDIDIDLWGTTRGARTRFYQVDVVIRAEDRVITLPLGQISVADTDSTLDLNDLLPVDPPAGASVDDYIAQLAAAVASTEADAVATAADRVQTGLDAAAVEAARDAALGVALAGVNRLASAQLFSASNITLSGEQSIDGTTTSASRVLVGGQTDATQNGVYISGSGAWARAADADSDAEIENGFIYVTSGTTYGGSSWAVIGAPEIGTDNIQLVQITITGDVPQDTDDLPEGASNKYMTAGEKAKVGHLTVTAATDLDGIRTEVAALVPDVDKPLSFDTRTALAERARGDSLTVPTATKEKVAVTGDGRILIRRDINTIDIGGLKIDLSDILSPLNMRIGDRSAFRVLPTGAIQFGGQTHRLDPFALYSIKFKGSDLAVLSFESHSGAMRAVLSPDRFEISGRASKVRGALCTGQVTDVRGSGSYFAYHLNSRDFSGKVIGKDTGDWAAPHIADAMTVDVTEADGQSWQTIDDYTPAEIDQEETSGATGLAISRLLTPMVVLLRDLADVGVILPDDDLSGQQDTASDGDLPGELHRFVPRTGFTISRMAVASRAVFQERLGLPANPTIVLNVGKAGTDSEFFLPENASYNYTDDSGGSQTTTAAEDDDYGWIWANNILMRDAIKGVIDDKWRARPLNYEFLTWIQGPYADYGNAMGFMAEYRAQQDALVIPGQTGTRNIMWDQNAGRTNLAIIQNGYQAAVDFCQTNASGKDWLVGPRYPHKMRDNIHHSSFGALEYAERTGQAMAYVQAYGTWAPLWITNVSFSGATVTLTTNRPDQAVGDLVVDTDAITANTNHGFTLWNATADTEISISSVAVAGSTITITAGATLSGSVEVGYAARGATRTAGTVSAPNHSATWGNIKMKGRDAPAHIPSHVMPTLDSWLCSHKKTYTI